ncbi:MAG TPA: membrane dipeptidase [Anaerolineales bacterium]|nr:membrane dipeptidase [Anaerolineales bacterium]
MKEQISRREFIKLLLLAWGASACRIPGLSSETQTTTQPAPRAAQEHTPSITSPSSGTPSQTSQPATTPTATPEATQTTTPTAISELNMIVDGHLDIAWNALEFGRDFTQSALSSRETESTNGLVRLIGNRTSGLPELIAGKIGVVFGSIFVMPANFAYPGRGSITYRTPEQAQTHAWAQLAYYHELSERSENIQLISTKQDLDVVLSGWQANNPNNGQKVGIVPMMEGADPIITPGDVEKWFQFGLRGIGPAWHKTRYTGGTGEPGPLTQLGHELLREMKDFNLILDLSHIAEEAYFQALDSYSGPVIASHSNPRTYLPTDRGLSEAMIQEMAAHDGVIGVVLYNHYLASSWQNGHPKSHVRLAVVVEVIDYIVQLLGTSRHVGIGSDFDGGFGSESIPLELETAADLWQLSELLLQRGYPQKSVHEILHGNWIRILNSSLPHK